MCAKPKLRANETEAANRAEVSALLIRLGYQIYRPEADVDGIDLVLRTPTGALVDVQLKSRLTVNWRLYGDREIRMLFPDRPWDPEQVRQWYLVDHDRLYNFMKKRHGQALQWDQGWSSATPSRDATEFLKAYRLTQRAP